MTEPEPTILLVEDDQAVRSLAARILRRDGYTVLEAEDSRQALERAAASKTPIALLLTDVVLPGMDGAELANAVRTGSPGLRVVYMSGFTEREMEERGIEAVGAAYVTKPFTAEVLTLMVRGALAP